MLLKNKKFKIENANIKAISNLIQQAIKLKVKYVENVTMGSGNYSEIRDDVQKLVSEGYFDNQ